MLEIPVASVKVQRKLSSDSLISLLGYVLGCFPLQIGLVVTVSTTPSHVYNSNIIWCDIHYCLVFRSVKTY